MIQTMKKFILIITIILLFTACSKEPVKPKESIEEEKEREIIEKEEQIFNEEGRKEESKQIKENLDEKIINLLPEDALLLAFDKIDFEEDFIDEYIVTFKSKLLTQPYGEKGKVPFDGFMIFQKDQESNWKEMYKFNHTGEWRYEHFKLTNRNGKALKIIWDQFDDDSYHMENLVRINQGETIVIESYNLRVGYSNADSNDGSKNNDFKNYLKEGEKISVMYLDHLYVCPSETDCRFEGYPATLEYKIDYQDNKLFIDENSIKRKGKYTNNNNDYYFDGEKIEGATGNLTELEDGYAIMGEKYYKDGKSIKQSDIPENIL